MGKPLLSAHPKAGIREAGYVDIFFKNIIYSNLEEDFQATFAYASSASIARRRMALHPPLTTTITSGAAGW